MKQKLNKKLVKRLPDVIVINDGTEEQLRALIKSVTNLVPSTFKNKFYEIAKHCVTSYNTVNCGFSKKGAEVISLKDFFKPAKVKLKDVDKPIWFPDDEVAKKYMPLLAKHGKQAVIDTMWFAQYENYTDIKWPKTKSSLEDRVTALEKESAANKAANLLLGLQNVAVNAENSMLRQYKGVEKIVKPSGEVREPVSVIKVTHDAGVKPSITVHLSKDENGKITDKTEINEKPIDWSKPHFFQSKTGVIVLCDGTEIGNKFGGTVVKGYMVIELGQYRNTWRKNDFKPFKGTITV